MLHKKQKARKQEIISELSSCDPVHPVILQESISQPSHRPRSALALWLTPRTLHCNVHNFMKVEWQKFHRFFSGKAVFVLSKERPEPSHATWL